MSRLNRALIMALTSLTPTRKILNRRYRRLDDCARELFHREYGKIFRRSHPPVMPGEWHVDWRGHVLRVPLRNRSMWLDWDIGVSLVGHDWAVKSFYLRALDRAAPDLFLDVGANYGTHSLLMASAGIRTIAFEPLGECATYAVALAQHNGAQVDLRQVAVGETHGELKLSYPARDTWLATAVHDVGSAQGLVHEAVPMIPLDDFARELAGKTIMMKIDVEGLEAHVIRGARRLLDATNTTIVFESWGTTDRDAVWNELTAAGYKVAELLGCPLDRDAFRVSSNENFIARRMH